MIQDFCEVTVQGGVPLYHIRIERYSYRKLHSGYSSLDLTLINNSLHFQWPNVPTQQNGTSRAIKTEIKLVPGDCGRI